MPLLMRFRRWWAAFFFLVLLLPTVGLFTADLYDPPRSVAAPKPDWWVRASERLDPYINDVFGFRAAVLAAHNSWGFWLGGAGNKDVAVGRDGSLFYRRGNAMEQSFGEILRRRQVRNTVSRMAELESRMSASGGRFVMLVAPNGQTMAPEALSSATRAGPPYVTEYDLLEKQMAARGVPFVDLRPLLRAAAEDGPTYRRNDTHWNARSAVIAFNAAMEAVGRPDLAYAPSEVLGGPIERWDGDLVRMLGLATARAPDVDAEAIDPPHGETAPLEGVINPARQTTRPPYALDVDQPGPRIMVLGDSFTAGFWKRLLVGRASALAWMHHESCDFDAAAIDRFRPDILIYIPAERFLPCSGASRAKPAPAPK